jgi:putative transposase
MYRRSLRKVCHALGLERSTYYYKSLHSDQAEIKQLMKEIAYSRVHYGYRKIHVMLLRKGIVIGKKKVFRLYQEMNLQLKRRNPNKGDSHSSLPIFWEQFRRI